MVNNTSAPIYVMLERMSIIRTSRYAVRVPILRVSQCPVLVYNVPHVQYMLIPYLQDSTYT